MSIFDPLYRQKNLSGQITRSFFYIGQAVKNMLWEKSKLEHLTPAQVKVLLFINYTRNDAITVGNIAKYLSCTPATVSGVVDSLEKKELIRRVRDVDDRRKVHIKLNPAGERVVGVVEGIGFEIEEIVSEFSPEEQEVLEKLLQRISGELIDKGLIYTGDICTACCHFKRDMNMGESKPHYCENLQIMLSEEDICKECPHYSRN